jgi:hypothetical protein
MVSWWVVVVQRCVEELAHGGAVTHRWRLSLRACYPAVQVEMLVDAGGTGNTVWRVPHTGTLLQHHHQRYKQWVGMLRTLETPRDCSVQLESYTLEQVLANKFDAKGVVVNE